MNEKKFLITTSLPYMNASLHIGHAYELVLADVVARYHRQKGEKVFFLTGADEHGDKIITAAQKEGIGPQMFVDKNVARFKELIEKLSITNDDFIRTSDKERHWPGAIKLWQEIAASGDIYKGTYKGLYCVGCEAFITEKELVDGKCPHHATTPEKIEEENYFFKLSKYAPEIKRLLESGDLKVTPKSKAREMLALIEGDIGDVSISRPDRTIPWGIPVPDDSSQLMYVWCDALSNYISALGYGRANDENFRTLWPADVQVIGKDIARFHIILWTAMLLSAKLPIPSEFFVHGFITSAGKKMSKSIGNVLYAEDFIDEYGVDALRYYLTREISPLDDGDMTHEKFKEVYNANLANGIGNLTSRTLKMAEQYFNGTVTGSVSLVPSFRTKVTVMETSGDIPGLNIPYIVTNDIWPRYHKYMSDGEVNKATDVIWELVGYLDQFVTDYEPFKLVKIDKKATENILWGLLYGLHNISLMLIPIMPNTAEKISRLVGFSSDSAGETIFNSKAPEQPLFIRK